MTPEEALLKLRGCAEAGLALAGRDWHEAEEAYDRVRQALLQKPDIAFEEHLKEELLKHQRALGAAERELRELKAKPEPEVLEPIYEGGAQVFDVRGETAYLDAGSIRIRGEGLEVGQLLEVKIFG